MHLSPTESEGAGDGKTASALRVGEVVAEKYRLERLLGSGGMAEIYAAVNLQTGKRVALKWVLPALASTEEGRTRFRREAQAAGRIHHPNVVTIFDVVEHQGSLALVMELLEGESLARRLTRLGKLSFVEAVVLILPAMRGVAAAHGEGVVHRDLKPDNIFVCLEPGGLVRECKVLDFGVSKLPAADTNGQVDITLTGNLVGTPAYMAPEQVRGARDIDHRADVYALGVVLYQMLAGRPPFVNEVFSAVMIDIATTDPPPLASFRPDVPRRLAQVVHRALERDADARFPDVPAFMRALEEAARDDLHLPLATPADGLVTQLAVPRFPIDPTASMRAPRASSSRPLQTVMAVALILEAVVIWRLARRPAAPPPATAIAAPAVAAPVVAAPAVAAPSPVPRATDPPVPVPAAEAPAAPEPPTHRRNAKRMAGGGHRNRGAAEDRASSPTPAPAPRARAGKLSVDDF